MLKKPSTLVLALATLLCLVPASGVYAQKVTRQERGPVAPEELSPPGATLQTSSLTTPLPTNPTEPLGRAADPRYFTYGGQTIALLGISGSYLPHIKRNRPRDYTIPAPNTPINPTKEYCTYDQVGTRADGTPIYKYQQCIDKLKEAGVNHLRLWVGLNHSVGMLFVERGTGTDGREPYPNEQPFARETDTVTGAKKWNLDVWDATFFTNLKNVVQYCQNNGIIVVVTLFDPWSGWVNNQPSTGVWWAANNKAVGYANGIGFTNPNLFVQAENPTADPETGDIDTQQTNKDMRLYQVKFMQRTVNALTALNNFYWELANEPDGAKAHGAAMINWHRYMARKLWEWEEYKGRHHLIAANLSTRDAIDALTQAPRIDIINGHYVHMEGSYNLADGSGTVLEADRFAAIKLLRTYNAYRADGTAGAYNTRRWGFNEGRISGIPDNSDHNDPVTGSSVRVEAWEFMLNGGAIFDHLSYNWANTDPAANSPASDEARKFLGYLSKFMSTFSLDGMKRLTGNQTMRWIATPPVYGSPYWAAMSNGNAFLFYAHRSALSPHEFAKYDPFAGTTTATVSLTVQNLGAAGCFKAEWFNPDGSKTNNVGGVLNGVLQPITTHTTDFCWDPATSPQRGLTSPPYKQDIVLKITRK